jgi:hypothetical protein
MGSDRRVQQPGPEGVHSGRPTSIRRGTLDSFYRVQPAFGRVFLPSDGGRNNEIENDDTREVMFGTHNQLVVPDRFAVSGILFVILQ